MPLPLIPILSALAAGGSLVPHAAGGMIVTGAGGYITGTYLSTTAIAGIVTTATGTLLGVGGATVAAISGLASSVIGSAGIAGTTVGATGLTGKLMSVGVLSSTSIVVPIAIVGGSIAAIGAVVFVWYRFREKLNSTNNGKEAQFSEAEAKIVERLVKHIGKQLPPPLTMDRLP